MTDENTQDDLGFEHQVAKNGNILIYHHGRLATILRGAKADKFLKSFNRASFSAQQQLMARLTGNYKRGNERQAKQHPRNQ